MNKADKLKRLKLILSDNNFKWRDILNEENAILEYEYFSKLSEQVISIYEFRNSRNIDPTKILQINSLINSIRLNNEEFVAIHHLVISNNRDVFIFTNLDCSKVLGKLSIGLDF